MTDTSPEFAEMVRQTKALNRAVKRNLDCFPADFMFQLTGDEYDSLRFQFGTLKRGQHSNELHRSQRHYD